MIQGGGAAYGGVWANSGRQTPRSQGVSHAVDHPHRLGHHRARPLHLLPPPRSSRSLSSQSQLQPRGDPRLQRPASVFLASRALPRQATRLCVPAGAAPPHTVPRGPGGMQGRAARPLAWGDPRDAASGADARRVVPGRRLPTPPAVASTTRRPGSSFVPSEGESIARGHPRGCTYGPVPVLPFPKALWPQGRAAWPLAVGGSGGVVGPVQVRAASWTPSTSTGRSPLGNDVPRLRIAPVGACRRSTSRDYPPTRDLRTMDPGEGHAPRGRAPRRSSSRRGATHVVVTSRCRDVRHLSVAAGGRRLPLSVRPAIAAHAAWRTLDVSRSLAPSHGGLRRGAVRARSSH